MTATQAARPGADRTTTPPPGAYLMLAMATLGFAVNFWAWALLSPLGTRFSNDLSLSSFQQALLVAVPVIVGSIGRIPVGILTDRVGARRMFPAVSFATILPVLFLGLIGYKSFAGLIIGGFFLGLAGTSFAVGVPFVNNWFPPARRGLAIGVFGMGMGGTAVSALTTVKLANGAIERPFLLAAAALAIYGVLATVVLRDPPGRVPPTTSALTRLGQTMRLRVTWQASALYAVGFGGYVAFSVYLPSYLKTAYELAQTDAANRMAGFVLLAVLMRPVGGWLSDKIQATTVLASVFGLVAILAAVQAATPSLAPVGTIAFLGMAAGLGAASGAVFALVAQLAPRDKVGSVTGVVGAAGGLGGFVPPLLMGAIHGSTGSYAIGLLLLAAVALAAVVYSLTAVRRPQPSV